MQVIPFHDFCEKVLNLHLTPGQKVIAKIAFGPYSPCELEDPEERDLALQMYGGIEKVPPDARKYVCMRLGRGSGKTTICAAFSVYQALTASLDTLGPGAAGYVIVVAPDKELAKLSLRMCREMLRSNPSLERLVVNDSEQQISVRRPDGRLVFIEAFAATRGGSAIRGKDIIVLIMDEAEFFTSNAEGNQRDYAVNDKDIFNAAKPRVLPHGKGMLISTPWPIETLMSQMFEENWGKPHSALAIKAPTILVRGNEPHIKQMVEEELAKDPENARRELFCELDGFTGGEFFDVNALHMSMEETQQFPCPFNPKWPVAVGCDFGFTRDSSAIAVVQYDGRYYRTVHLDEERPSPGKPLKPSAVIKKFAETARRYGVSGVVSDGYYREAIKEALQDYNLLLIDAPEGAKGKAEVYQRTRSVLHEGLCRIPDVKIGRRMLQQAKLVTSKPSPGGTVSIKVPRKIGLGHGDIVSAWVLAVADLAYARVKSERIAYEPGTPEWNAEFMRRVLTREEKMQADYLKKLEKQTRQGMNSYQLKQFSKMK